MNRSQILDGGAYSRLAFQAINRTATAGGGGDATEVDGEWVDRMSATGLAMSAKLGIAFTSTFAAVAGANQLSFAIQIQDATAADGTGAADYGSPVVSTVVQTGESGGSVETGAGEVDINLSGANRYIRAQITPDLSAATVDTLEWAALFVLFGEGRQPTSQQIGRVGYPT